jgi:hypothetical protein
MTIENAATRRGRLPRKRAAALALVLLGVAGLTAASAATLRVDASAADGVAAGSANVASCATSVTPQISGYRYTGSGFVADSVTVAIVGDCVGRLASVAVADGTGTVVATGSATVAASAATVPLDTPLSQPTSAYTVRVVIS